MLHIVNQSPLQSQTLASCLRLAQDGHAVLLIEDGIYAATHGVADACGLRAAAKRLKIHVLRPDAEARGVAAQLMDGVLGVDYAGFVDLVAEHSNNQSWL
jgi:tRNA 2-thiouridine synthesizing protein B